MARRGGTRPGLEWAVPTVAVLAAAATVAVCVFDDLRFAYRSFAAHIAVEAVASVIALLAAVLVAGRFRRSGSFADLALLFALTLFAATNLALALVPGVLADDGAAVLIWARIAGTLAGFLALAVAAFADEQRRAPVPRSMAGAWAAPVAAVAALGAVVGAIAALDPAMPSPVALGFPQRPQLNGDHVVVGAQILCALASGAAAVGFLRRTRRRRDDLLSWLALAAVLGAFSRINFALYPSDLSAWVSTADILRLGFYLVVLTGSLREILRYGSQLLDAALLEDRRRIARDLHDGMAQEIAFIVAMLRTRGTEHGWDPELLAMHDAAERALRESREAIDALSKPGEAALPALVADAARLVAHRARVRLNLDLAADVDAPAETADALVRITREAVTNATRHGRASVIDVRLWSDEGLRLRIRDDGTGFTATAAAPYRGLGLSTMRERADALGGRLVIDSAPGSGTSVELVLPQMSP